jgi:CIC family chloride channel protein
MALLQGNTNSVIGNSIFGQFAGNYWSVIIFMVCLLLLKVIATSSTNGAGGVGGIFAPTLFIGGVNGYIVASLLNRFVNLHLPVLDNGYYVGFISKARIYSTYRELLIQFSEE